MPLRTGPSGRDTRLGWKGPHPNRAEDLPTGALTLGAAGTPGELAKTQVPGPKPVGLSIIHVFNQRPR